MNNHVPRGYKQTEVGVIPEDWNAVQLHTVCAMKSGEGITAANIDQFSPYPCYGGNGLRGYTTRYTHDGSFALIGRQGALCGNVVGAEGKFFASEHAVVVTPRIGNDIKFLTYVLGEMRLNQYSESSAQPGLSVSKILKLPLAVPSDEAEQRAIAGALSNVDALLDGLDRLIAKTRDLKQAVMQQLLTGQTRLPGFQGEWEETTLGRIGECIIGLTYKPENVVEHGLLVLRSSNVQNGRLAYDDNVYVNFDVAEHLYTREGDILVCVRNGSRALIGKCAVIDESAAGVTFGAFMSVYRTKHWRYIFHAFQADDIQRQIRDNIGATINQITNKDMNAFRVKLPPEPEQTAIAAVLSDIDAELAALEARRDKTRLLKQGMMQELLTGRIRLIST